MSSSTLRIPPPLYYLMAILAMILLHLFAPLGRWLHYPWRLIGIVFILSGFSLSVGSAMYFRKLGTKTTPGTKPTLVVTTGPFRFTRNPMYLGLLTILVGISILLGTISPLIVIPVIFLVFHTFVSREEKWMEEWFGDYYLSYKKKTRRWLL
ncbi:MAG: methyltransferase family protein [Candidatus Dadabacteria bacterium]